MENGTMEGRVMREWLDQMSVLEEQAQVQQLNRQQRQRKTPQDRMFDAFVSAIIKEFLAFIRQKQQVQVKQQQQAQKPPKPPGFNPRTELLNKQN